MQGDNFKIEEESKSAAPAIAAKDPGPDHESQSLAGKPGPTTAAADQAAAAAKDDEEL